MCRIKFDQAEQGYNKEQVDRYIDKVEKEYKGLLNEYQQLEVTCKKRDSELLKARKEASGEAAAAVMIKAEMIAGHTKNEAEKKAEELLDKAKAEAERIVAVAEREARDIVEGKMAIYAELQQIKQLINYLTDGKRLSSASGGQEDRT